MKVNSKGKGPVFISGRDKSVFGKTIKTFLINELNKRNIEVSLAEENAYKLDWSCQKIHHNDPRYDKPGLVEMIFINAPKAIFFGGEINGGRPHYEILLTFKLQNNDTQILRKSNLLYIADIDQDQYQIIPDTSNNNNKTSISNEATFQIISK